MRNTGLIIGIVVLIVLVVLIFGAGMMGFGSFGMGPGMMNGGMMGGAYNPLGAALSLVVWAVVIGGIALVVVMLVRNSNTVAPPAAPRETPLDILKARYARGEITPEQYAQMRKDLEG